MSRKLGLTLSLPLVVAMAFATAAWARTFTLQATPMVPGATGSVDAKSGKNAGNTSVDIKVDHLARPTLLSPPASQYVVWIQPENGEAQNEGNLLVGENEKGSLTVTTTASKFTVMVTAESDTHPTEPSKRVVLHTDVLE